MRRSWLIELAGTNAATNNKILNWQAHTRTFSRPAADVESDKYRARGFYVRITQEWGGHGVTVFGPTNPSENASQTPAPQPPTQTPEERLNAAILSFAHGVNNDFDDIIRALYDRGADGRELAADLTKLRDAWRDASHAALASLQRDA